MGSIDLEMQHRAGSKQAIILGIQTATVAATAAAKLAAAPDPPSVPIMEKAVEVVLSPSLANASEPLAN
jgi:hypothetical protein